MQLHFRIKMDIDRPDVAEFRPISGNCDRRVGGVHLKTPMSRSFHFPIPDSPGAAPSYPPRSIQPIPIANPNHKKMQKRVICKAASMVSDVMG